MDNFRVDMWIFSFWWPGRENRQGGPENVSEMLKIIAKVLDFYDESIVK